MSEATSNMRSLTLLQLGEFINGYAVAPMDIVDSGLPIVRIEQLKDDTAKIDYFGGIAPERNLINNGDLIFSWSASLFLRVWDRGEALLNQHLFKVIPAPDIEKNFLRYCLEAALPELVK